MDGRFEKITTNLGAGQLDAERSNGEVQDRLKFWLDVFDRLACH